MYITGDINRNKFILDKYNYKYANECNSIYLIYIYIQNNNERLHLVKESKKIRTFENK